MNKKFFFTLFLFVVGVAVALIYRRYNSEFRPEKTRTFYLENNDSVRFTQRLSDEKSFVEESIGEEVTPKNNPRLEKIFSELEGIKAKCDAVYEGKLAEEKIIDPESDLFSNTEQIAGLITSVYEEVILNRERLKKIVPNYLSVISQEKEVSVDKFYSFIQMMMSCFSSDMSFYVETSFEVKRTDEEKKIFEKEVVSSLMMVVNWIITEDKLPDGLLFTLNIFRAVGEYYQYDDEYFSEVDNLYDKITNYEEVFFSDFEDVKYVSEPSLRMESYLNEMELIADDFKFFYDQRFSQFR